MRTPCALTLTFFVVFGTASLAGQVIPPPRIPKRPAQATNTIYLVTFRQNTPAAQRAAAVQASGARLRRAYNAINAASVEIPDAAALSRLQNDPRVLSLFASRPITLLGGQGHGVGAAANPNAGGGAKPRPPANLSATATSSSQINLSWTDGADNETGFAIERCAGAGCTSFSEITRVDANITTFSNPGLTAQTTYRYRVLAFNAAGNSKYSNIAEATTFAPPLPPPAAPNNLTSSAVSSSQINLTWSDNSTNESGFKLERCAGALASCTDPSFAEIAQLGSNVTSFNNVGLQAQTPYTYRVRAFNSAGSSGYSNVVEATTLAPPPPVAPSNLISSVVSSSQINLTWSDNSTDESGFKLERCTGALASCTNPNFAEIAQLGPNVTSFNNVGLQAQTTYTYRVRAFSSAGSSTYSNAVEATTLAAPPPIPTSPNNLTLSVVSSSQINLNWSDNSNNEDGFRLERCTGALANCADINFVQIAQSTPNITTFSDQGLQAQTSYIYRVRAFNVSGSSSYSNYVQATTPAAPPPVPTAPSSLALAVISSNQINLVWSDNSNNEDGFRIQRCTGTVANCADANFVQIAQVGANIKTFNNVGLQSQTTYTYRVRSFNSSGASTFSNTAQAATPVAPPSTQVVPAGVQRIGAAPGTLTWTGTGVGVAIVDTGLDFTHPDLALAPEIPGVNSFSAFSNTCQDIHYHGTHVAGIVGAKNNAIDVVGVAPNATIYCVNVFEPDPVNEVSATDESVIAGLDWIAANANVLNPHIRVVNMSLGREKTPDDDNPNHPLHLAVKALYDMGISVVVAAGNDALSEVAQQIPAGYAEVMAVASTTAQTGLNGFEEFPPCVGVPNIKADTASYFTTDGAFLGGTGVTISAPGESEEDIYSFADACFLEPAGILSLFNGGGTVELEGTSMASPHVAGVVALMWEKELSLGLMLSPESARTRIRNNADRRGTAPLDSPLDEYTFDGEREGVIWAPSAVGDAPPPAEDTPPTVSISSPSNGSSFSAGANIVFQGTATDAQDGNIAPSLVWTSSRDGQIGTGASFTRSLSNGNHVITASLTDSGGNPGSASTNISVGASSTPTQVQASSITYALQGTTLNYTVKLVNEFGGPVPGATVNVDIMEWLFTGWIWISTTTSDSQGNANFQLQNADLGCYIVSVRSVTATGLTWVGGTPSNNFCNF